MSDNKYISTYVNSHKTSVELYDSFYNEIEYNLSQTTDTITNSYVNEMDALGSKLSQLVTKLIEIGAEITRLEDFHIKFPHDIVFDNTLTYESSLSADDISYMLLLHYDTLTDKYILDSLSNIIDRCKKSIDYNITNGILVDNLQANEFDNFIGHIISMEVMSLLEKSKLTFRLRMELIIYHRLITDIIENGFKSKTT